MAIPRIVQRDAYVSEEAPLANLALSYCSSKDSAISLPYENRRVMKDALKLNY
jgi:hypothetical protein